LVLKTEKSQEGYVSSLTDQYHQNTTRCGKNRGRKRGFDAVSRAGVISSGYLRIPRL
jgi:hypothetical protein